MKTFKIYHGTGKNRHLINEADCFDNLATALSVYRKLNYSNITVFHPDLMGIRVDNQPDNHCGVQTGWIEFDYYGCWYDIAPDNGTENFLMIGDYPYEI